MAKKSVFNCGHERWEYRSFKQILKLLRTHFPPDFPVEVNLVDDMTEFGSCSLVEVVDKNKSEGLVLKLNIAAWQCEDLAIVHLMHEWAHAITWTAQKHVRAHGPEFGVAHAKIYTFIKEGVIW